MSKEDIINYVMTTPGNPNRAVLSGMLDSVANAGGGGTSQFIVHGSDFRGTTFVADKTYAEIAEAYQNGADIVLDVAIGETTHYIASLGRLLATEADFGGVHWNGSGTTHKAEIFTASIASDGTVSCVTSSI